MKIYFDNVSKKDGRLLVDWWNGNRTGLFILERILFGIRKGRRRYRMIKQ